MMNSRRSLRLCAGVLFALLSLGACTGGSDPSPTTSQSPAAVEPSATPEPAAPPRATAAPAPENKVCYRLSFGDALSPTNADKAATCNGKHTAMTFHVGRIDNVVGGHLLAVDSKRVQAEVAQRCPERFSDFVGGSERDLRLSMLRTVWFTPGVPESDQGEDWVRCDAIAIAGSDRLAPLGKGRLSGVLGTEAGRERYAMCGTAAPDAKDFERVLCSEPHRWRAVEVVGFDPGAYPGADTVRQRGQGPCEDAGRSVAADALDFEWGYEFPTREQWQAGQTFGRCWAPD
ncbi:hypothetical protein GCM10027020_20720 [Nocardioides salsibiostraticola]